MSHLRNLKFILAALLLAVIFQAQGAFACASCYSKLDEPSRLADGMNWGIFSLLIVVGFVLSGVAGFGIFLAKRSAAASGVSVSSQPLQPTE
jgi:uncharacterized membrane protein